MTNSEKYILKTFIEKLQCDANKARTSINEKNLIQAKLHIAKKLGLPVPISFKTISADIAPFSADLIRFLNDGKCETSYQHKSLKRPYNKIINLVNSLEYLKKKGMTTTEWFELLSCGIYYYRNGHISREFRVNHKLTQEHSENIEKLITKLYEQVNLPKNMPKIKGLCEYIDIFDENKDVRSGILFDNGHVIDIKTGEYIDKSEAVIKGIKTNTLKRGDIND